MLFFIHQYVVLVTHKELHHNTYQYIIDLSQISCGNALLKGLSGKILFLNANAEQFYQIVLFLDKQENTRISEITLWIQDKKTFKEELKQYFEVIKASGGVVIHRDKVLMIFRRGKWDLPKGKIDDNEDAPTAALREVAEECNLQTQIKEKICTTWHHYWMNGKIVVKKTKWYAMTTPQPQQASPQHEEDIEEIRWVSLPQAYELSNDSFPSVNFVLKRLQEKQIIK